MRLQKILALAGLSVGIVTLTMSSVASAHVVVRPAEVVTAGFQTFTVGVPNEKDVSTTSVRLVMPSGLNHVSPTQKPGWRIDIEKEDATVESITWDNGTIDVGFRDEFTFSAQVSAEPTELQWKAYQTYADGTVVSWDQPSSSDSHDEKSENSGPFSITQVVANTAADTSLKGTQQAATEAKTTANRALYVGIAGIVIGLTGVALATRKK